MSQRAPAYLREIWRRAHWRLFEVLGATPLAQAPAVMRALGDDSFTLRVPHAGSYVAAGPLHPLLGADRRPRVRAERTRRLDGLRAAGAGSLHVGSASRWGGARPRPSLQLTRPSLAARAVHRLGFHACSPALVVLQARALPHGWLDVLRQVSLFAAAYLAYRLVRGLVEGDANAAFAHARDVISLERTLHIFVEPSVQAWASGSHLLMDSSSWLYVNAQTTVTVGALVYLYLRHNRTSTSCATCS